MNTPQIVWLRRDLRLADQPAFHAAASAGPVIPVYVLDDETPRHRRMGGASRWWLYHSLAALSRDLEERGLRLILREGQADRVLAGLARETGAGAVHCLRHYEPWWRNAERALGDQVTLIRHDGNYMAPPGSVLSGSGAPFKIFTPFYKALLRDHPVREPLAVPSRLQAPAAWPDSDRLEDWGLLPGHPDWASKFADVWQPGEAGAQGRLEEFSTMAAHYEEARNFPSIDGSSRLSAHLHFGEISPTRIWHRLAGQGGRGVESFLRELVWRDYGANVIAQFPDYGSKPYREDFARFGWRDPETDAQATADLKAWQQGRTGYPIVDAGMRQLWQTGWMHNRVRMIAASFLVKHLLIDWRHGERWFWDTLVDADYASNAVNWQWVAGTGVDSNIFVRIMAPLSQSEKFDAAGYIRRYVAELSNLDEPWIHDPAGQGCRPRAYPAPLVEHRAARERALAAWEALKGG